MYESFGPTKNKSSIRTIKMDKEAMNIFKDYFKNTVDNIHELIFFSHHSKYHVISNRSVNKALKGLLADLAIEPISISVHVLRHTHASALIYEKKATINYISERLGHSDVQTTYNDYSHVMKELRAEDEESTVNMFSSMYKIS